MANEKISIDLKNPKKDQILTGSINKYANTREKAKNRLTQMANPYLTGPQSLGDTPTRTRRLRRKEMCKTMHTLLNRITKDKNEVERLIWFLTR